MEAALYIVISPWLQWLSLYTVGHKKTCHFILDYNFGVSWWISTLCTNV